MDYTKKIDFSSLDSFLGCPRKFLFQYVLNLRPSTPNIDLTFGSAWHYGMEMVYTSLKDNPGELTTPMQATTLSVNSFNKLWALTAAHFNPEICFPKNPGHAADMYYAYWKKYFKTESNTTIVAVETPFKIHLGDDLPAYIGRLDLAILDTDYDVLTIIDHKTSKYDNAIMMAGYEASFQTDGYLTAGHIYFDKIPRIVYNIAVCQKSRIDFTKYMIMRSKAAIDRFLDDLIHHTRAILANLITYNEEKEESARTYNPLSFKRVGNYACTKYFRKCPYFDLCHMRNNPFPWAERPPEGFTHYEWDPDTHQEELDRLLEKEDKDDKA